MVIVGSRTLLVRCSHLKWPEIVFGIYYLRNHAIYILFQRQMFIKLGMLESTTVHCQMILLQSDRCWIRMEDV